MKSSQRQILKDLLREKGLRATSSRVQVLHLLRETRRPMSHAEVSTALAEQGWDRATLYRNLCDLERVGLLRIAGQGARVKRYEDPAGAHDALAHAHFVCVDCGGVECLPDLRPPDHPRAAGAELQLRGHCPDCREAG